MKIFIKLNTKILLWGFLYGGFVLGFSSGGFCGGICPGGFVGGLS